jgi:hypothetical protein
MASSASGPFFLRDREPFLIGQSGPGASPSAYGGSLQRPYSAVTQSVPACMSGAAVSRNETIAKVCRGDNILLDHPVHPVNPVKIPLRPASDIRFLRAPMGTGTPGIGGKAKF